jgi:hypothetical protein
MSKLTKLYDTNCIYAYRYTNGIVHIAPLVDEDGGQFRFFYPCIYELHNLTKRNLGIEEANLVYSEILNNTHSTGNFPVEYLQEEDNANLLYALQDSVPESPKSGKSKRNSPNLLDVSLAVVASRLGVDLISTDSKLVNYINKNSSSFGIKAVYPYPSSFKEVGRQEFFPETDDNKAFSIVDYSEIQFQIFLEKLTKKGVSEEITSNLELKFRELFPE